MAKGGGEVWRLNFEEEMTEINQCFKDGDHIGIAIDTEFPGCLIETPMNASEETRYMDMKFNVDNTKPIQLGFTLFDDNYSILGTWEVNFSDFNVSKDEKNDRSIQFLRSNGLNLEKIREEGIEIKEFFKKFSEMIKEKKMTWVTFQGSYDTAYLLKGLTGGEALPESSETFGEMVKTFLGENVFDVKKMAPLCGLNERHGLQRMANELEIERVGEAHHAGSDSELTARVFFIMLISLFQEKTPQESDEEEEEYYDDEDDEIILTPPPTPIIETMFAVYGEPFGGGYLVYPCTRIHGF